MKHTNYTPSLITSRNELIKDRRKKLRAEKGGYTQENVAEMIGISTRYYQEIESIGKGLDSVSNLKVIAEVLGINLVTLINLDE